MPIQLISFFSYFAVLLTIGILSHRSKKSSADFIVGNRSVNFWLTSLSAHASDMSAWLFMGLPAAIYDIGIPGIWIAVGLTLGMFCNWQWISIRLRISTEKYKSNTLSTYFEKRFNDSSGTLRLLTAVMTVIFVTCYITAGLIAMGRLFESLFGLNYYFSLTVASLVAVTYTFVGGFVTIAWTDFFQGIFLLVMIIIVPIFAFFHLPDGFATIHSWAIHNGTSLGLLTNYSFQSILQVFLLTFGWGLGYFGQPHIITKFMGINNPKDLIKSKYLGMSWQILALTAAVFVGFIGIGLSKGTLEDSELIFVLMVKSLFIPFFAGFVLCSVIAANMSTMDSQLLVAASVIGEDIFQKVIKKKASPKELLLYSRYGVLIVAFTALIISYYQSSTVLSAVLYAWSGLGSAFGPLVITSLYSKTANRYGAIAGILVGGGIAGIWPTLNPFITTLDIPSMIPAFFLSMLSIFIISKMTAHMQESDHKNDNTQKKSQRENLIDKAIA